MIVNRHELLLAAPIKDMLSEKKREHGVSYGLAEAGYDIRIKQDIRFQPRHNHWHNGPVVWADNQINEGRFVIASAIEEFDMPDDLVGVVHDKSTWARRGLSVFNTVIEPGWKGFLTLELVYHGTEDLYIPAGAGIAQILFSKIQVPNSYDGKYQNQADMPVAAIHE
jgi:dCTP deaminase